MRLFVFCEAEADFRTAGGLIDRVLHDEGPTWVADLLDHRSVTPLDLLRERGEKSGLRAFLHEVRDRLVPLC